MRIFNFLLALAFIVLAALHVNGSDPLIWILIYGAMAVVCILAMFEFYRWKVLAGLAVVFLLYGILFFPGAADWFHHRRELDFLSEASHSSVEAARKFLGLITCDVVLIFQIARSALKK